MAISYEHGRKVCSFPFLPKSYTSFENAKSKARAYAGRIGDEFAFTTHEAAAVKVHHVSQGVRQRRPSTTDTSKGE